MRHTPYRLLCTLYRSVIRRGENAAFGGDLWFRRHGTHPASGPLLMGYQCKGAVVDRSGDRLVAEPL